jgi:hypothetical protein
LDYCNYAVAKSGAGLLPAQPVEHPAKEATDYFVIEGAGEVFVVHLRRIVIYDVAVGFAEELYLADPLQPLQGALHAGHSKAAAHQAGGAQGSPPSVAERFIGEQVDLGVDKDVFDTRHWLSPNLMPESYQMEGAMSKISEIGIA